ncbi:MAG TPA: aminoacyl-tRNA hydrolase [Longimicrobiaceae bacterium]|nr:aminoacyl-tRNA hydrolase [Longimicrobiaceae bacterium]
MGATRVIVGLGNPGAEYSRTRHNVGWWLLDRLAEMWSLGRFRGRTPAAIAEGRAEGYPVKLVKPLTYMNRSGSVVAPLRNRDDFDLSRDLLVIVDDVALEPGRARFRAAGSAGGHNGLKSIEASLGTREYCRLRIGVGGAPPGADLARWVLAAPSRGDRDAIGEIFPDLMEGVILWMTEGSEAAMRRCNS